MSGQHNHPLPASAIPFTLRSSSLATEPLATDSPAPDSLATDCLATDSAATDSAATNSSATNSASTNSLAADVAVGDDDDDPHVVDLKHKLHIRYSTLEARRAERVKAEAETRAIITKAEQELEEEKKQLDRLRAERQRRNAKFQVKISNDQAEITKLAVALKRVETDETARVKEIETKRDQFKDELAKVGATLANLSKSKDEYTTLLAKLTGEIEMVQQQMNFCNTELARLNERDIVEMARYNIDKKTMKDHHDTIRARLEGYLAEDDDTSATEPASLSAPQPLVPDASMKSDRSRSNPVTTSAHAIPCPLTHPDGPKYTIRGYLPTNDLKMICEGLAGIKHRYAKSKANADGSNWVGHDKAEMKSKRKYSHSGFSSFSSSSSPDHLLT